MKESESSSTRWPLISLAAMLWATDQILRPQAQAAGLSSIQVVLFEHVALAAIFVPFLIKFRSEWKSLTFKGWMGLGFIAVFGSAIATVMLTEAYRQGTPLLTALLQKTQPLFAVALATIWLREKHKPIFWAFFAGAIAATLLLANISGPVETSKGLGVFLALGAAAIWGTCTVVGRIAIRDQRPQVVTGWRFMLALPFLLAVNAMQTQSSSSHGLGFVAIQSLALIVIFPDALGMTLYKKTPASLATIAELAFPATALIIGLVFQHQSLTINQWYGLGLLLFCLQGIQSTRSVSNSPNSQSETTT